MLQTILNRRSVRSFLKEEVDEQAVEALLKAGFHAPSAMNQRPWHFIVLKGEKLADVLAGSPNTPKGSPLAIVVCVDESLERFKGLGDSDAAAATQNILLAAESLGLGAVWSAVLPDSVPHYRKTLNIPTNVRPYSIVPVGKPAQKPEPTDRYDAAKVHWNSW